MDWNTCFPRVKLPTILLTVVLSTLASAAHDSITQQWLDGHAAQPVAPAAPADVDATQEVDIRFRDADTGKSLSHRYTYGQLAEKSNAGLCHDLERMLGDDCRSQIYGYHKAEVWLDLQDKGWLFAVGDTEETYREVRGERALRDTDWYTQLTHGVNGVLEYRAQHYIHLTHRDVNTEWGKSSGQVGRFRNQLRINCGPTFMNKLRWSCSLYWISGGRDRRFPQEFLTQCKAGLVTPNMGHRFRDIQKPSGLGKFNGGELFNAYFGSLTPDIFRELFPGYDSQIPPSHPSSSIEL